MTKPASPTSSDQGGATAGHTDGSGQQPAGQATEGQNGPRPLGERSARLALERRERRARRDVLPTSHRQSFVECPALVGAAEAAVAPRVRPRRSDAPARTSPLLGLEESAATEAARPAVAARASSAAARPAADRPSRRARRASTLAARPASQAHAGAAGRAGAARSVGTAVKKLSIVTAIVGFAASGVLPLLATTGDEAQAVAAGASARSSLGSQTLSVDTASLSDESDETARDTYSATSMVDVVTQNLQNRKAAANTTYEGPTTADYLANPLYPELDRDQVLAVALQYIGTPYVHGGEDPSKFDCSGLITFVYAQFGIKLTHYVPTQNTEGRTIPESEAVPGDLVVFDNLAHDGIYAGNGMILDAPKPGGFVDVRPIWNQAHHFVRIDG
ncbi:C40 family peptidase [Frigoribacterium sp. PhB24]|uniref:C40 family peptidase n=1 Tax=Frigoribacterium sp. PhB24 TaxID=2485204 RepID=UPI000F46C8A3|nr:C40 family peptidase [Frigoribacterium sp. PhB24]ROS49493.1 cell wall-associated NlpC family hydrolase [Frigoribacterium sp. PhB24]